MSIPYIYQRTPTTGSKSGSVETGIAIQNSTVVRQFGTSDWTRLRVAIRLRMIPSSSYVLSGVSGTPRFAIGLCNGTDNVPGDNIVQAAVGAVTVDTSGFSFNNNYWNVYTSVSQNFNPFSGSLISTNDAFEQIASSVSFTTWYIAKETSSLDALFIDFEKSASAGVPQMKTYHFRRNSYNNPGYYPDAAFASDVLATTPSQASYTLYTWAGNNAVNVPFTGSYPLNSVFITWDRSDPILEITDLYIVRLA